MRRPRRARPFARLACLAAAVASAWPGISAAQDATRPPQPAPPVSQRETPAQADPRRADPSDAPDPQRTASQSDPNAVPDPQPADPQRDPRIAPAPPAANRGLIWDRARLRADLARRHSEARRELIDLMASRGARHPRVEEARQRLEALSREMDELERNPSRPAPAVAAAAAAEPPQLVLERAAYLGVAASPATPVLQKHLKLPDGVGLVVDYVEPGSPAEAGGIEAYDVLVRLDEQLLINAQQLAVLVRTFEPGAEVRLRMVRAGEPTVLALRLVEREVKPIGHIEFWDPNDATGGAGADGLVVPPGQVLVPAGPVADQRPIEPGTVLNVFMRGADGKGVLTGLTKNIDADGTIRLPNLPKPVKAVGLTPIELHGAIAEAYREAGAPADVPLQIWVTAAPDAAPVRFVPAPPSPPPAPPAPDRRRPRE
jgi:hypothetical protein